MGDAREDEIAGLEEMFAGKRQPQLQIEAAAGRLAELYLEATDRPERFPGAYRLAHAALSGLGTDDPLYPKLLHVVAAALRAGGAPDVDVDTAWTRAESLDRDSWLLSLDPAPQEALLFAQQWGDAAWREERWAAAAAAYEGAEIALNRLILREKTGLAARVELLASFRFQATRAAFAYASTKRPKEAMVVLERAAALLSSYGEQRQAIRDLATAGHTDLHDRLHTAMELVAATSPERDNFGRQSQARLTAQASENAVVAEIRALQGWSQFATLSGWHDIQLAAQRSALAYLAPTDKGTAILGVDEGAQTMFFCCVKGAALDDLHSATVPWLNREFADDPGDPKAALNDTLCWLGEHLVLPIHQALGGDHRVTLIPFGVLALYPLHAGWVPTEGSGVEGTHVLFHPSNVSYAYSARTLMDSIRRNQIIGAKSLTAVVVNNPLPLPVQYDTLLLSDFERDAVATHFEEVRELAGRAAVAEAVLDALTSADVAHFSCHGTVDSTRSYSGVLLLARHQILTAEQFAQSSGLVTRLVVLSACRSGAAALGPAAVASLPSTLIAAGVSAVLTTLWHTDEMATLLLIGRFYALWQQGRGKPASEALGLAQEWLAFSSADELRATCPPAGLANPAGAELACADPASRPYNEAWFWAAFILVGDG